MSDDWETHRPGGAVLAVSADADLLLMIREVLGDGVHVIGTTDGDAAAHVLETSPLRGMVVDGGMPQRMATTLAREYLRRQPTGRVVVLGSDNHPSTLIGLALRDRRIELLFRPIDQPLLRQLMVGAAEHALVG